MAKIPKIKLDNYQPLRDVIFETLRNAIVNGDLRPGSGSWRCIWRSRWA